MMGARLSPEEQVLLSSLLSRWSGCDFKIMDIDPGITDPMSGRRGWIAAKDGNGLVDYIGFTDDGLVNHPAPTNSQKYVDKESIAH